MRREFTFGLGITAALVVVGMASASGTTAPPPPKQGVELLQCPTKFTMSEVHDFDAEGWTETRTPEQLAADYWGYINPMQIAGTAVSRIYDQPDVVQLAYSKAGRVDIVHTFTRSSKGWQNDYIDMCSTFQGQP